MRQSTLVNMMLASLFAFTQARIQVDKTLASVNDALPHDLASSHPELYEIHLRQKRAPPSSAHASNHTHQKRKPYKAPSSASTKRKHNRRLSTRHRADRSAHDEDLGQPSHLVRRSEMGKKRMLSKKDEEIKPPTWDSPPAAVTWAWMDDAGQDEYDDEDSFGDLK